ncbi:hypothetical protein FACS1894204_02140 [Synergistales bacterium]|nr:hypothetical protein FACS1894204_02140 [Synergistales bacterium]
MIISHFAIEAFEALRGVSGTLSPRISFVSADDESNGKAFVNFIKCFLSGCRFADAASGSVTFRAQGAREIKYDIAKNQGDQNNYEDLNVCRRRLYNLEILLQVKPLCIEAQEIENVLSSTKYAVRPKESLRELEALLDAAADIRFRLGDVAFKRREEDSLRRSLEGNLLVLLPENRESLENLKAETDKLKGAETENILLSNEINDKEKVLRHDLRNIATDWTEEGIATLDLSLDVERNAAKFQETRQSLNQSISDISRKLDMEESGFKTLQSHMDSVSAHIKEEEEKTSDEKSAHFQERRDRLAGIRSRLRQAESLSWENRADKMYSDALEEEINKDYDPPNPRKVYLSIALLIIFILFSGAGATLNIVEPSISPYGIYASLFFALLAAFPMVDVIFIGRENNKVEKQWNAHYIRRNSVIDKIGERIKEKRHEIHDIAISIEQTSKELNISPPSSLEDIDALIENFLREESLVYRIEDWKRDAGETSVLIGESSKRISELRKEHNILAKDLEKNTAAWQDWLKSKNFDKELTMANFASFLSSARKAQENYTILKELKDRMARHEKLEQEIDAKFRVLSGRMGVDLNRKNIISALDSFREGLELKNKLNDSVSACKVLDETRLELEKDLQNAANKIQDIYNRAGVKNEAAFRAIVENCEKRARAEERLGELRPLFSGFLSRISTDNRMMPVASLRAKTAPMTLIQEYFSEEDMARSAESVMSEIESLRVSVAALEKFDSKALEPMPILLEANDVIDENAGETAMAEAIRTLWRLSENTQIILVAKDEAAALGFMSAFKSALDICGDTAWSDGDNGFSLVKLRNI